MNDLTVTGTDRFAGDTLATIPRLRLVLGLGSVWRSLIGKDQLVVRSIALERPTVRLRVLEDGTRNWDILRDAEDAPERRALDLSLENLEVHRAAVALENRKAGLSLALDGLDRRWLAISAGIASRSTPGAAPPVPR